MDLWEALSGLKIWHIPRSDGFIMTSHQITDVVATLSTAMVFFHNLPSGYD